MGGGWFAENACISMRTRCPTASRSCPRSKGGLPDVGGMPDVGGLLEAGGPGGAPALVVGARARAREVLVVATVGGLCRFLPVFGIVL